VKEVRERASQIKELIDRAKAEAEPGLMAILEKWEQANQRILEKYPENEEMDFDQLEAAGDGSQDQNEM
jgi:hypothetical protein